MKLAYVFSFSAHTLFHITRFAFSNSRNGAKVIYDVKLVINYCKIFNYCNKGVLCGIFKLKIYLISPLVVFVTITFFTIQQVHDEQNSD